MVKKRWQNNIQTIAGFPKMVDFIQRMLGILLVIKLMLFVSLTYSFLLLSPTLNCSEGVLNTVQSHPDIILGQNFI